MARSKETSTKRQKEMKRLKEIQQKKEKMEERRANPNKGKQLEDMMAYLDENGNLSSTPPDPSKKRTFSAEEIEIGVPKFEKGDDEPRKEGTVNYFNYSKGFGFINYADSDERLFVHISEITEEIAEGDKVTFEIARGARGYNAVAVKRKV
jgi:cold shock CspA family protein